MDRIKGLVSRLEDEKNEEIFPVCIAQLIAIYSQNLKTEIHLYILKLLRQMTISKKTFKRLLCAAIIEKLIEVQKTSIMKNDFYFKINVKKFESNKSILSHLKGQNKKEKKIDHYDILLNFDLLVPNKEKVKQILSNRDNFLYSKSEKQLNEKEKNLKTIDEKKLMEEINSKLDRDQAMQFLQKRETIEENKKKQKGENYSDSESEGESYFKKNKNNKDLILNENESEIKEDKERDPDEITCVLKEILDLAKMLVFNQNWELRHGALLIFRAVVRKYNEITLPTDEGLRTLSKKQKQIQQQTFNIEQIEIDNLYLEGRNTVNELVKQRCLVVLSLDRFSDFLADKSNMTNRALAAEILVAAFQNIGNFDQFFFLFEYLISQPSRLGWEPKQAVVHLLFKIYESDNKKINKIQKEGDKQDNKKCIVPASSFFILMKKTGTIIEEHEEIADVAANMLSAVLRSLTPIWQNQAQDKSDIFDLKTRREYKQYMKENKTLYSQLFKNFQSALSTLLLKTEDISYLPKSVFESFNLLLTRGYLEDSVVNNLDIFVQKFICHDNSEVRYEIFLFLNYYFSFVFDKKQNKIVKKSNKQNFELNLNTLLVFFKSIIFYFLMDLANKRKQNDYIDPKNIILLSNLLVSIIDCEITITGKVQFLKILSKIISQTNLSNSIKTTDQNFLVNADIALELDIYEVLEIFSHIINSFPNHIYIEIEKNFLINEYKQNTLLAIPFLKRCSQYNQQESEFIKQICSEISKYDSVNFTSPDFESEIEKTMKQVEEFLSRNMEELEKIENQEQTVLKLLEIFDLNVTSKTKFNVNLVKSRIMELYNNLVIIFTTVKNMIEQRQIPFKNSKICFEIESTLLPQLDNLYKKQKRILCNVKTSISAFIFKEHLIKKILVDKTSINQFVKPFFELFTLKMNKYWSESACISLFGLVQVYRQEKKHPNTKILESLLKSAEADNIFKYNILHYIYLVTNEYKDQVEEHFPAFSQLMAHQNLSIELFSQLKNVHAFCNQMLILLKEDPGFEENIWASLASILFLQLNQLFIDNNCSQEIIQTLNDFLTFLLDQFKLRAQRVISLFHKLLNEHKMEFIPYAKIYLGETIRALNDQIVKDKLPFSEVFSKVLTLSYLETLNPRFNLLDNKLKNEMESGRLFLYEFTNHKNFDIDFTGVLNEDGFILKDYQAEGIKWLNFLIKYQLSGALCDDMGLGKTIQSLVAVALQLHRLKLNTKSDEQFNNFEKIALVICPNSVQHHWEKECFKRINFSYLKPFVLTNQHLNISKLSLIVKYSQGANLFIISHSLLSKLVDKIDFEVSVIILDEAHLIKNPKTQLAQNIKKIQSGVRIALTGTPIQNNVTELWSIFDFLMPSYLGPSNEFRKDHKILLDLNLLTVDMKKMELNQKQKTILDALHARVLPFLMRREKGQVLKELPPKVIQDISVELTPVQEELYKQFEKQHLSKLEDNLNNQDKKNPDQNEKKKTTAFLSFIYILRKILNHPILLTDVSNKSFPQFQSQEITRDYQWSGKLIALKELLNSIGYLEDEPISCEENQNKLLIFSRCAKSIELISEFLTKIFPNLQYFILKSSQTPLERHQITEKFNEAQWIKILLLTPKIGGLGLNLTSSNVVVMFDHDFNPVNDLQAMDRAHRLGQKQTVQVYRLVCANTLEEKIMGIQRFKLSVANTIVNIENASLTGVQQGDLVEKLENFVKNTLKTNVEKQHQIGLPVHLRDMELEEWDENEYEKEYISKQNK